MVKVFRKGWVSVVLFLILSSPFLKVWPQEDQGGDKVFRGNSWDEDFDCYGRSAFRNFAPPVGTYPSPGFRCV